jgi:hypothetical protein
MIVKIIFHIVKFNFYSTQRTIATFQQKYYF